MNRKLKVFGIVCTLVIHLAVLFFAIFSFEEEKKERPKEPPKETSLSVRLLKPEQKQKEPPKKSEGFVPDKTVCESKHPSYEGIGIVHQLGTSMIIMAPEQYPAYQAGIRVGDMIVEMYKIPNSNLMFVEVNRHGVNLSFKVKRQKICYDPGSNDEN